MITELLCFYTPDTTFRRAAGKQLLIHFPDTSQEVWQATRTRQSHLLSDRPRHSFSVNMMMRYMEWSCALYFSVREHGMNQTQAGTLVEKIITEIYQPVWAAMYTLTRLRSSRHTMRVTWLLGMVTRFFFTAPFRHRHLHSTTDIAFDVTVCPFADYFKDRKVPELTANAACNMDYCTARELGIDLGRSQTIANGAAYCDFRCKFSRNNKEYQKTGSWQTFTEYFVKR